jgi:hypothetical protein
MSTTAASLSTSFSRTDIATRAFTWGRYGRPDCSPLAHPVAANAVFFYLAQVEVQYDRVFLFGRSATSRR